MELFSSREIATYFWLTVFVISVLALKETRSAALNVIRALFDKRLVRVYTITIAYIVFVLLVLSIIGFWSHAHLKSTVIWFFTVAMFSLLQINKIMEDFSYFKRTALNNFQILVAVEFVISTYTLSLWLEILLVPFLSFVVALLAVAQSRPEFQTPKYDVTRRFLNGILMLAGFAFIILALKQLVADVRSFFSIGTLSEFMLPIVLTLSFLPYLFLLAVYAVYETVFSTLPFSIKDKAVRKYAHSASILAFLTNVELLQRWKRDVGFVRPETKESVRISIRDVLNRRKKELSPESVSIENGWSPYAAKDFLVNHDLKTEEYRPVPYSEADEWFTQSSYREIGNGILPNNIAYYVDGSESTATKLKIAVTINDPESATDVLRELALVANDLTDKALGVSLIGPAIESINNAEDFQTRIDDKHIIITRENFRNRTDQYNLSFIIQQPQ